MFSTSVAIVLAALAPSALATIYVTSPVAGTKWTAGVSQTITWQDDGVKPSLADFGPTNIGIFVGSVNQQYLIQYVANGTDVSKQNSINVTPDVTLGDNSEDYFIRFASVGLKDSTNAQFPAESFSAKFTMGGMTGKFNSTVQAAIDGALASSASASATAGGPKSSAPTSSSSSASKPASTSASASGSAKQASASSGAESKAVVSGLLSLSSLAVIGSFFL